MKTCFALLAVALHFIGAAQKFPHSFVGQWQGSLLWYRGAGKAPQKVPMQLHILPADTAGHFTWKLVYSDDKVDSRPYLLKGIDTANGRWVIDERNGIIIDQWWLGGKLSGAFTVQNSTIVNNYWLEGGKLMVEFLTLGKAPISSTGLGTQDSPTVDSYAVKSYQRAVLYRRAAPPGVPLRKKGK